jgi:ATP-dependent protease ClpP protease subunit
MGITIINKGPERIMNISSTGGSAAVGHKLMKMIKNSEKPIKVNIDALQCSIASMIIADANKYLIKYF